MKKRFRCEEGKDEESMENLTKKVRRMKIELDLKDYSTYPIDLQEWVSSHFVQKETNKVVRVPIYLKPEQLLTLTGMIEQHRLYLLTERRKAMNIDLEDSMSWPQDLLEWYQSIIRNEMELESPDYLTEEERKSIREGAEKRRRYLQNVYPMS
jgi:hypothetical protein